MKLFPKSTFAPGIMSHKFCCQSHRCCMREDFWGSLSFLYLTIRFKIVSIKSMDKCGHSWDRKLGKRSVVFIQLVRVMVRPTHAVSRIINQPINWRWTTYYCRFSSALFSIDFSVLFRDSKGKNASGFRDAWRCNAFRVGSSDPIAVRGPRGSTTSGSADKQQAQSSGSLFPAESPQTLQVSALFSITLHP